jgi:hypothetical protein
MADLPSTRGLDEKRLADLEKIADYFEDQAWHKEWPDHIIFALARVNYSKLAPFTVVHDGKQMTQEESDHYSATVDCLDMMSKMQDIRDKNGDPLPG